MSSDAKQWRSQDWFDNRDALDMTALHVERYLNYGLTPEELCSGRPIIAIAQTGSDLATCNRHHLQLADRVKTGIRDAGGIPMEFPVHPLQETGRRPTAALDRNLAFLDVVEVLHGYPLDGAVLMTGCDKTTPALLMAAAAVNLPAIVLSGGPILDGHRDKDCVGSGAVIWEARRLRAAGSITDEEFLEFACASAPSVGHCNTMGAALSMNCLAEALGMSLPGCAAIPAPYRERAQMAYRTGRRVVELVQEGLRPSDVLTRRAFENAIVVGSAIGASSNCPSHLIAIARQSGVALDIDEIDHIGYEIPLLVNCQPAGAYLGEAFHRAGGVPAVMSELLRAGLLHPEVRTVTGHSVADNLDASTGAVDHDVVRPLGDPLMAHAGFAVLHGNFFDSALLKTSAISESFAERFLRWRGREGQLRGQAVVFDGPEDYRNRINDPGLDIDEHSILVMRGCGPIGYPGSAEVVNMLPPDRLVRQGVSCLPCVGDGRQSGTSNSPSILQVTPESATGGGLALIETGDTLELHLGERRLDVLLTSGELAARATAAVCRMPASQTPWQELYRQTVEQLDQGAGLRVHGRYVDIAGTHPVPRHSH